MCKYSALFAHMGAQKIDPPICGESIKTGDMVLDEVRGDNRMCPCSHWMGTKPPSHHGEVRILIPGEMDFC